MPYRPTLTLVASNGDFGRKPAPKHGPNQPPAVHLVANNGPKIRIQMGVQMVPRNPITDDYRPAEMYAKKVVCRLPAEIRPQILYGNSGNLPVAEFLHSYHKNGVEIVWMLIRESSNDGPWPDAETLTEHIQFLHGFYADVLKAVQKHCGSASLRPKLMMDEREVLPEWFADWQHQHPQVLVYKLPDDSWLFSK
jgi:hypothetical protein